jgi:peptidoglycan/LPS O-acetylase OafA/YrhL
LRLELSLYFWVAFTGATGLLRYRWLNPVLGAMCLAFTLMVPNISALNGLPNMGVALVYAANLIPFFMGAWVVQSGFSAKQLARITAVAAVVALVLIPFEAAGLYTVVLVPLLALLMALGFSCDLSKYGDYSYGLYLWGYPIQQTIIQFWPTVNVGMLFAITLTISAAFALASWHLLEKKALLFKPNGTLARKTS